MGVFWSLQHDPCLIDPFLTDRQEKLPSIGVRVYGVDKHPEKQGRTQPMLELQAGSDESLDPEVVGVSRIKTGTISWRTGVVARNLVGAEHSEGAASIMRYEVAEMRSWLSVFSTVGLCKYCFFVIVQADNAFAG